MPLRIVIVAILLAGLAAGTVDVGAAALISGKPVGVILQFIAGGLLGKAALAGGAGTQVLGLVLQWAMSMIIAAIFAFASLRLLWLRRRWILAGLAFGVPVYVVMNYVVAPLSAWGRAPHFVLVPMLENLAAMLVFGLIVAAIVRWRLGVSDTAGAATVLAGPIAMGGASRPGSV